MAALLLSLSDLFSEDRDTLPDLLPLDRGTGRNLSAVDGCSAIVLRAADCGDVVDLFPDVFFGLSNELVPYTFDRLGLLRNDAGDCENECEPNFAGWPDRFDE